MGEGEDRVVVMDYQTTPVSNAGASRRRLASSSLLEANKKFKVSHHFRSTGDDATTNDDREPEDTVSIFKYIYIFCGCKL